MAGEKKFLYLGEDGFLKPSTATEAVEITASSVKLTLGAAGADSKEGVVHMDSTGLLTSAKIVNTDITDGTIANGKLAAQPTSAATADKIVLRDSNGDFAAGTITADLTGNVTGNLTGNVTGVLSGNASTASKWETSRTLSLDTDLGGSVSIDGSANVTLSATIGTGAVTATKLGTDSVITAKIQNGAVTADKLGTDSVITAKIQNAAVTADKLGTDSVITAKIQNAAVTADKLGTDSVTTAKIQNAAVTADKLGTDSVITAKIQNGAVTKEKIAAAANVAYLDDDQSFTGENIFTQSVAMAGASMTGAIAMGASLTTEGFKITGLKTGVDYYDAANWGQVQSLVSGVKYKDAAKFFLDVSASPEPISIQDIASNVYDSGSPVSPFAVSDRILIKGTSDAKEDGLYVFGASTLARPADFENGQHAAGAFIFCDQKVTLSQSGFVASALDVAYLCSNTPGSDTIGTAALTFIKYSGAEALSFTAPLYESADGLEISLKYFKGLTTEVDGDFSKLKVAVGNGIKIDASSQVALKINSSEQALSVDSNGLSMALASGNTGLSKASGLTAVVKESSGLSIDNNGIQLNLDPAGSLEASGDEVKIKLDGATLSSSSSGLKVEGLPSEFKIAGSGVHAAVSAANLNKLVDGEASYADTLHSHSAIVAEASVTSAISAGIAVYINSSGMLTAGNCSAVASAKCVGISLGRDGSGGRKQYALSGLVDVSDVAPAGAQPGDVLYMGTDGSPVLWSSLAAGNYVIKLGRLVSTEFLAIAIQDVGIKS
jgi:hypothetical protein